MDESFLIALNSNPVEYKSVYWRLEENPNETRINIDSLKNILEAYITPDEHYLILIDNPELG